MGRKREISLKLRQKTSPRVAPDSFFSYANLRKVSLAPTSCHAVMFAKCGFAECCWHMQDLPCGKRSDKKKTINTLYKNWVYSVTLSLISINHTQILNSGHWVRFSCLIILLTLLEFKFSIQENNWKYFFPEICLVNFPLNQRRLASKPWLGSINE